MLFFIVRSDMKIRGWVNGEKNAKEREMKARQSGKQRLHQWGGLENLKESLGWKFIWMYIPSLLSAKTNTMGSTWILPFSACFPPDLVATWEDAGPEAATGIKSWF